MNDRDEFYVGYLPTPPELRRWLRRRATALLLLAGPVGVLLAAAHTPTAGGHFDYGHPSEVRGEIELAPTPAIRERRGETVHRIPLVGLGKHGASELQSVEGRAVRASVTRIARGRNEMYELAAPPEIDTTAAPLPPAVLAALGAVVVRGEIVDGKCDLGVMDPGEGGLHQACAVRCLSGGVPPMLLMKDAAGAESRVALAGRDAPLPGALVRVFAGAAVEIRATLVTRDGTPLLLVADEGIRRLP